MGRYKICVYAIAKNEEKFVDRWMDAVSEADLVVVLDTGSSDGTVQKLRNRGAAVYTDQINPWRFDTARNKAMDHIPKDFDLCVSNDLDEVFEKGWREKLEAVWRPSYTRARYLFTYAYRSDGTPEKQFAMEKIHRRKDFRWVHPVHEILEYKGKDPDRTVFVPGLVLNHHPDPAKSRSQYLPLLELSVQENPNDDRAVFWLGREYMYNERFDDCIHTLQRHLKMPSATWDEERSASMRFIAESYQRKNDLTQAKAWLFRAIAECPHVREPYLQMTRLGYSQNDWPLVYFMTDQALKITKKTGSYLLEPQAWGFLLDDYAAIACYWLGLYRKGLEHAQKACDMSPNDQRLKNNLEIVRQKAGGLHEPV
ncbi:glycosyltransferase [Caproiciproducens sp. NJN-50]|uniref:glycosyltransferase n=1 Tax=Acutalibacteraceae TaxID=3082771 RepID=UPI000FFE2E87|nr:MULTISPECIES: glycosyltransferase [Acutalibacteraceae]QAT50105.1 glycosyltransferase [Caproiciproducens sp. NJN-50]